jgi:hypothetical protein
MDEEANINFVYARDHFETFEDRSNDVIYANSGALWLKDFFVGVTPNAVDRVHRPFTPPFSCEEHSCMPSSSNVNLSRQSNNAIKH